ncbi:MAG: carboxypeptidase regulatory-like domain-containing protein, partial [Acidobacteriaceae bacterium]|nr:carboxypeptidase regulatory-like domain-containing protein [Acidobacteriaceae bacterium]
MFIPQPNLIRHFARANGLLLLFFLICTTGVTKSQSNSGDLRLRVTDPSGAGVRTSISITSDANNFRETYATDDSGAATVKRLPYGIYSIDIRRDGFAPFAAAVEIRSAAPTDFTAKLSIQSASTSVEVKDSETLIDPYRTGSINRIGTDQIEERETPLPGRSLQDLINTQPGWIYEGNAVLHPRGSEYQTQIVVDGIPLQDNRSPSFGPEIEADDIDSLGLFTADFPAEYGRKMGGIVELNTTHDLGQGFHGKVVLSGGSFDTAGGFASGQYQRGKNTLGITADGDMTGHYLDPVVPQN